LLVSRRLSYPDACEPVVVTVLVTASQPAVQNKRAATLVRIRAPLCCSPISPPLGTRGQGIREGKDTKDRPPVRVSFEILLVSPDQDTFEDTKDTKDSFYTPAGRGGAARRRPRPVDCPGKRQ